MALKVQSKKKNKEVNIKLLIIGFVHSFLEMNGDLSSYSPAQCRSFFEAALDLWLLDPNRIRFIEKLHQFFGELEDERKPPFGIGRHIAEYVKNQRPS